MSIGGLPVMGNCFYDIGFLLLYLFSCVGLRCGLWDLGCDTESFVMVRRLLQLRREGSRVCGPVVAAHGLSCPSACGVLVPLPGIQPSPTALEGRFLTTGPPGKSPQWGIFEQRRFLV